MTNFVFHLKNTENLMKRTLLPLLFLFLSLPGFSQLKPGYQITMAINGLRDSTIFLAYHFGDKQYLKDTVRLDHNGRGVFSGKEALPQGIYMVVLPGRKYFEILVPTGQYFSLSCSYPDYFKTLKFSGSQENEAFIDYQRKWTALQGYSNQISTRLRNNKQNSDSLKIITETGRANDLKMKNYLNSVVQANKGNLLGMVVKAIIPVDVPEIKVHSNVSNPDSVKWIRSYIYNKDHFFDNIDFNDERILRTPILYNKLNVYFSDVLIQNPDSINREIDRLVAKSSPNKKVFQFVAVFLFNHFRESEIMGHDAVVVKLADDIYLSGKADWTTKEWRDNLRKEVDRVRPNLIGVKGHDLVMNTFNGVTVSLYDIKKDFVILYFWEPNCGHCQEATPKLKAYYDKAKNEGVEVFAVCTQNDRAKWEKYIQDNKLNWINGWDPQRATNYDYYYNITSTPGVYILDRNKKIIAKKLPVEAIGSFIENYRKYQKSKP
jgi:thiol-disulfide isomerase/thioredoxin